MCHFYFEHRFNHFLTKINRSGNETRQYHSQKTQAINSNSKDNYNGGFHYYANCKPSQVQKRFPKEPAMWETAIRNKWDKGIAKQFGLVTCKLISHLSSVGVTLEKHWLKSSFLEMVVIFDKYSCSFSCAVRSRKVNQLTQWWQMLITMWHIASVPLYITWMPILLIKYYLIVSII